MASTKEKKKRTPKQKTVQVEQEVAPVVEQDQSPKIKDYLEPNHLLQLETMSRDILLAKNTMHLMEQELRNMVLENQILLNKIEKQKLICREKHEAFKLEQIKFDVLKKQIWPQYGLELNEGLGYDPLSGKISKG